MTQPAERRTPLTRHLPGRPAVGLAIVGMVAAWLILLGGLVAVVASFSPLSPMKLLALTVLCGGIRPAKPVARRFGGGRWVRSRAIGVLTEAGRA